MRPRRDADTPRAAPRAGRSRGRAPGPGRLQAEQAHQSASPEEGRGAEVMPREVEIEIGRRSLLFTLRPWRSAAEREAGGLKRFESFPCRSRSATGRSGDDEGSAHFRRLEAWPADFSITNALITECRCRIVHRVFYSRRLYHRAMPRCRRLRAMLACEGRPASARRAPDYLRHASHRRRCANAYLPARDAAILARRVTRSRRRYRRPSSCLHNASRLRAHIVLL